MKISDLDSKNKKLIAELQKDGRKSLTDLGKILDLSHVSVQKRLKKLVENDNIQISANISTSKMELSYAVVLIEVDSYDKLKSVIEKFSRCPRLVFFGTMTGAYNVISILVAETQDTLQSVINVCSMRNEPGLRRSDVFIIDIPVKPQFVPMSLLLRNDKDQSPCGTNCNICERYASKKCAGCPGTKWYNL